MMISENKIQEIQEFLKTVSKDSKVYLGCDSVSKKKPDGTRWATYTFVVVIHKENSKGCKVFYETLSERDFSESKKRPSYRLMMEVQKTVEAYTSLFPILEGRDCEVHLDLNPNKKYFSSTIVQQAIGYIRAVTGNDPKIKPDSWCASHAADHAVRGKLNPKRESVVT